MFIYSGTWIIWFSKGPKATILASASIEFGELGIFLMEILDSVVDTVIVSLSIFSYIILMFLNLVM